jgi:CPA2 family monovalent cation:H+ antiporter-2
MESGFSLSQIGEFSFIIATLGTSLGVLDKSIYPIIVAVSVITTFTTPFFIKQAVPCYNALYKVLPKSWTRLLNGYSQNASESESSETRQLWRSIVKRFFIRLVIYSVVIIALIALCRTYLMPFILKYLGTNTWGRLACVTATLAIVAPFITSIILPTVKRREQERLVEASGSVSYVPLVVMSILSAILSTIYLTSILDGVYSSAVSIMVAILLVIIALILISTVPTPLRRRVSNIEKRFINNINERENRRTGREHNLVSDLQVAYMTVGHDCPFVGDRLRNLDLRSRYGVNLVNIQRGNKLHPVPTGDMRIFPGDVLGVIGNEEQIQRMLPLVEAQHNQGEAPNNEVKFIHFAITKQSPLVGVALENTKLREDYGALLVAVQRGEDDYISPTPDLTFHAGDILWIVGNPKQLAPLKG